MAPTRAATGETATPTVKPTSEPGLSTATTNEQNAVNQPRYTTYNFSVQLDYNNHLLNVTETILYVNQTGKRLDALLVAVPPNKDERVFTLHSLNVNGEDSLSLVSIEGVRLTIPLALPIEPDAQIDLNIAYRLEPRRNGGILGYSARQLNCSDWYPFVPPYIEGQGWLLHDPGVVGEYLTYDLADFNLDLQLINAPDVIAAVNGALAPFNADHYTLNLPSARNLVLSFSDQYSVIRQDFGGIEVKGYVFEEHLAAGQAALLHTGSALLHFSDLFGVAYPRDMMTFVESDFPDGMEYDGLYYLSQDYFGNYDGTFQNYLSLLSVHETAHQWWSGLIGNDQALEPWLDESLATYSELFYIENFQPDLIDWWWQYRVDTYKPSGRVNLTIYDTSDLRTYINAVYLQGARMLHDLRQSIGDEAFLNGIQRYVRKEKFKIANWSDFLDQFDINDSTFTQTYFKGFNPADA